MRSSVRRPAAARLLPALSGLCFALLLGAAAHADPPTFSGEWEKIFATGPSSGFNDYKVIQCAAVDPMDHLTLVVADPAGVAMQQLDPNGNNVWTTTLIGSPVHAYDMVTDATGNIFVIGGFSGTLQIQGHDLVSSDGQDIFVASFTPSGVYRMSRRFGSGIGTSIALTPSGEVMIGGSSASATLDLGNGPIPASTPTDAFLARLDASLDQVLWNVRYQKNGAVDDMVVDVQNNVYAAIDWDDVITGPLDEVHYYASTTVKFDSSEQVVWARQPAGYSELFDADDVFLDPNGNLDVTGSFVECDYACLPGRNSSRARQYQPDGSLVYSSGWNFFGAVGACMDGAGHIYVTGSSVANPPSGSLSILDAQGNTIPITEFSTTTFAAGEFVHVNGNGEVWVIGSFRGTITLNGHDYTAVGNPQITYNGFVVKGTLHSVAVAISSFNARPVESGVELRASFQSNLIVERVNVYRGAVDGQMLRLTEAFPQSDGFNYVDNTAAAGTAYRYQIGVVDQDGEFMSPIETVTMPGIVTALEQNAPNPFNPVTTIRFSLATREHARLQVYSTEGKLVRTLLADTRNAGHYSVDWDGRNQKGEIVSSGVYFYRLTAGKFAESRRMVLLK